MKIVLIKPYWRVERQAISPPLGLLYLAAYLREKMNPSPELFVIDQAATQQSLPQIEKFLDRERPDIVGITGLTYEEPGVKVIAASCKRLLPKTTVILGGPHATIFYDHVLENTQADIAVQGEGEVTFLELVERIRDGKEWNDVLGIAYREKDGHIVKNSPRPPIENLDSLPFPAWDLIDVPSYAKLNEMNDFLAKRPYMFIFTSRACPYGCIYCHQVFGKKYRPRSVENTMEEIRRLVNDVGIRELHILDDIFNWDIDRAKEICRGIIREGIKVSIAFPNGIRGDRLDDELIELLAKAGCYSMTFAVETATPRLQRLIRKFADLDKLNWAITKAYNEGVIPMGFFMLGFPTETREEMEETIRFACRSKIIKATFFSVTPFPRTKMFELFRETYPNDFNLDEQNFENMHYFTSDSFYQKVTGINLASVVRRAYRSFYFDPKRIAVILLRFPWNRSFLRGMYHGFRSIWAGGGKMEMWWSLVIRRRLGMSASAD